MIHSFAFCQKEVGDIGKVTGIKDTVVTVTGFKSGRLGEGVVLENDLKGMIEAIDGEDTQVVLFSREALTVGMKAARTDRQLTVSVGRAILGHTINALGYFIDKDKQPSADSESEVIEVRPWGIERRQKISRQLLTGLAVTDLLLPLGEGQRELIIGNKKTGKTEFALKIMLNQVRQGKVCVYALMGKKQAEIHKIEAFMRQQGIEQKCVLVAAPAGSSPGEIFLAPFTAMTVAEHFRDEGESSLVILDDLTFQAKYLREIALLANKFPGRESYPGEVFYTHARLLERAGNFLVNGKTVSITALPIAETLGGDLTGYIQTNLMSMTDGHLFFDEDLFLQGVRPAINVFLSVTRVGRQTQPPLIQQLNGLTLKTLKQSHDAERYLRFGAEVTEMVNELLRHGDSLRRLFNQEETSNEANLYPVNLTMVLAGLILFGRWDGQGVGEWVERYSTNSIFKAEIDSLIIKSTDINQFKKNLGAYGAIN